jgi:hydroxymethylpyrimidine/phosphomethylpyrimidine kinase
MKTYPRVLTIAGSDSGGGAGIQADIKAISATGSYAASAITAVTVQNTLGVEAVHPVPTEIIVAQIRAVLSDIGADAIKIGMLHSAEVVLAVRDALLEAESEGWLPKPYNIVLDPVMVSTSGHRLIEESAIKVLTEELLPLARVITPNIPEAEILAGRAISSQEDLPAVARELSAKASRQLSTNASRNLAGHAGRRTQQGMPDAITACPSAPVSVLMKAGHLTEERLVDIFYDAAEDRIVELPSERVHTPNTHGTGCTLSSAFASFLAQGYALDDAARAATGYIHAAIDSGAQYAIGHGHGPVDHFYAKR